MKRFYANAQLAQQITANNSGCDIEILREQPEKQPEDYEHACMYIFEGEAEIQARQLSGFHHRVWSCPLYYPTDKYVVYAPKQRCIDRDWADLCSAWINTPTKTDIILNVTTTVKRLSELTWKDKKNFVADSTISELIKDSCGSTMCYFIDYWNNTLRHAKPRKTKDRYECFPYDESYDYTDDKHYFNNIVGYATFGEHLDQYYKGLPLTIYANCWIEVHNWRKE